MKPFRRVVAALPAIIGLTIVSGSATAAGSTAASSPSWRVAYVPHIANGLLFSITAPTNKSVWAIGRTYPKSGTGYSFLLHWNGNRWRKSGMPVSGFQPSQIASSAPSNVWMFGLSRSKSPLVLRWNGSRWLRLPGSGLIPFSLVNEAVLSPTNVWIASEAGNGVAHWNGSSWTAMPSSGLSNIQALGATSSSNVWLAGITVNGRLAAYRWRSGAWVAVRMPHPVATFASMAVQSATSVWITEISQAGSPMLYHWKAGAWFRRVDKAGWTNLPLAPYGRTGVWVDPGDVWTGRSWLSVGGPVGVVGQTHQIALAAVPRTTSAWLAEATLRGPEIWRK